MYHFLKSTLRYEIKVPVKKSQLMSPEFDKFLEKINKGTNMFPQTHSLSVPDNLLNQERLDSDPLADEEQKEGDEPTNTDRALPKDGEGEVVLEVEAVNHPLVDESQPQSSQLFKKDTPYKGSSAKKGSARDSAKKASINAGSTKIPSTRKLSADGNGKEKPFSSQ